MTLVKGLPSLLVDADGSGSATEGDTLTLTNTGDLPLTSVVVNDPQLTPNSQACSVVAVEDSCVLTGNHVVGAAEAAAGEVVNTGSATSVEIPSTTSNTVTTRVAQQRLLTSLLTMSRASRPVNS